MPLNLNLTVKLGLITSIATLLLVSCGHKPEAADAHNHGAVDGREEEPKTTQITVWGDRYEVFIEHRLIVTGAPTRLVTHVTDLKTFEPRTEGPIRLALRAGQEPPNEHTEEAPSRPGIYEPTLTFPKPGDWDVSLIIPGREGESVIVLPKVRVYANADQAERAEVPPGPHGISFLKEQQWRIGARTERVTKRKLVEQLRLAATVAARPGAQAQVIPPVAGRLALPPGGQMPVIGQRVEAGQVLALIQPSFSELGLRFVEAEGEVIRSKLALEQAELAFKRVEQLAKVEAKSGRELQEAQFELKTAKARHDAALAVQASYRNATTNITGQAEGAGLPAIELRTPISGTIISQSKAAVGEYVLGEKSLFTVLDASGVFIEAHVPEASMHNLRSSGIASYQVPGDAGRFVPITGEGGGRLVFLGIQVDAETRTVPLLYEATNSQSRLRIGQALNLYVETARSEEALSIAHEALAEEGGRPVAFVQSAGETFERRELTLGIRDGQFVQVISGLKDGERVVSKGAYAVRLASISAAIPSHGHAH